MPRNWATEIALASGATALGIAGGVIAGEAGLQHAGAGVADDRQHCDCTAALPSSRCGKRRFTPFQKLICLERSVPFKGYKRPFCTSGDHCKFRTERGMWLRIL